MNTIVKSAAVAACAFLALGMAAPANAAPGDHGRGSGIDNGTSVSGCIDQLYGNATNPRLSGHGVLPSVSPGPWVAGEAVRGASLGAILQLTDGNPGDLHDIDFCPFITEAD